MPVESIWNSKDYMTAQYFGFVTFEENRNFMLKLPSDYRWGKIQYVLSDWTRMTRIDFTEKHLKELAIHLSVYDLTLSKLRVALVPGDFENAEENGHIFVAMMAEHPVDVKMLPTIAEAEEWLLNINL